MMRQAGRRIFGVVAVVTLVELTGLGASSARAAKEESWDAVFLAGAKVGHIHTYLEPVTDRGRKLLRVRVDTVLKFKRLNDPVTLELHYGTIETPEGEVLKLDTRTVSSDTVIRAHGDVIDGKMVLKFQTGNNVQRRSIDWGPDVRGPYAPEQSLARSPMTEGEVRDLKMFMPDLNQVCDVKLTAVKKAEVELGGGTKRLLMQVEQATSLNGKARREFAVTLFADDRGQVLKSQSDNHGGMVLYRTTREGALIPNDVAAGQFDQIGNSVIKVPRPIQAPAKTRNVRYKVTLKDDDPADVIPNDRRQSTSPGSTKNEAILVVKTAGRNEGTAETGTVDPVYLRPNPLITSDDSRVIELARKAVGNATDPWDKAVRVEKWVARNIKDKNFKTAFAPASEVAVNLSGDCTEHGVLAAAMCRASGVPARVVVGLIYASDLGGFGFHLWNEVYVNHRWVAFDSSFEQDDVDAVHIKLTETSLDGVSPFEAFIPIVRVLGKMTIEPIEVR